MMNGSYYVLTYLKSLTQMVGELKYLPRLRSRTLRRPLPDTVLKILQPRHREAGDPHEPYHGSHRGHKLRPSWRYHVQKALDNEADGDVERWSGADGENACDDIMAEVLLGVNHVSMCTCA